MRHIRNYILSTAMLATMAIGIFSCKSGKDPAVVVVHELSDTDMLNPTNYSSASAGYIMKMVFPQLLGIDYTTLELIPWLAESRPELGETEDGKLTITYRIREEAAWDNGEPVTAKDVEFSLKVIKNPHVKNERIRPYYEFIEDMVFYDDDPKKFTFVCKEVYILAEASSGDFGIIPAHNYDPNGLMSEFTIKQLTYDVEELKSNQKLIDFANDYNSEKRQRENDFVEGCGPYKLEQWATGQRVVLKKKDNWWGDKLAGTNCYFDANAPRLVYQTINDQTAALVALKNGDLDVMRSIKSKDFADLPESEKFTSQFHAYTPMQLAYTYIGINTRLPKFSDKRVRQAFAHLVDVDKMIETIKYGQAERVIGQTHPSNKGAYNNELVPYDFSPEKAKALLAEAGWADTDGDGFLDKEIEGEKTKLAVEFIYNSGNDERKAVALLFQEEARKIGIDVTVNTHEWSKYLDITKKHEFEMYYGAWISSPVPNDPKQIYHRDSYNGGSNYTGFGNDASDALIDSIRVTLNEDERNVMYKRLQAILHDEVSYIYLWAPTERLAIHKRFTNAEPSVMRPGYWEAAFTVGNEALAEN